MYKTQILLPLVFNLTRICLVNIEDSGPRKRRAEEAAAAAAAAPAPAAKPIPAEALPQIPASKRPMNAGGGKKEHDKASDDFYFEKFRRQFRR